MKITYPGKFFLTISRQASIILIWASLFLITGINISYQNWQHEYKIIYWDVNFYYAYLPMTFIYHDFDMDFVKEDHEKRTRHYWTLATDKGKRTVLASMGLAMLYSPFFLTGHAVAQFTPWAGDEFSPPYKIALIISCLFYLALGLFALRKVLMYFFSERISILSILVILFGTNLLHYVTEEPTMSHAYNFSLIAIFLYVLIKWFESPGVKYALLAGALAGLITLIRPTNIIVVILLLLWGITSFRDFRNRLLFYLNKPLLILLMASAFVLVWVPQFIYWHHVSGSIFFNPHGDQGLGFFFNNPQVYHVLFSYRKGWFLYTPLMFLALCGFYQLYRKHRGIFWPTLVYFLLNLYILSSWWAWWYGGSFGQRSFIDSYAIMAFPVAGLMSWTLKKVRVLKYLILAVMAWFIFLNIFQTIQYKRGIINDKMMTKITYWYVFLDMSTPGATFWNNLVFPDYKAAQDGIYYPETEIPLSLEKQLGMRGWQYVEKTRDSLIQQTGRWEEAINENSKVSIDSLAHEEAMDIFRRIVKKHYSERP